MIDFHRPREKKVHDIKLARESTRSPGPAGLQRTQLTALVAEQNSELR